MSHRRTQDPVPKGFVGSNPTPRTKEQTPELNPIQCTLFLMDKGLKESTIRSKIKRVKRIAKMTEINNPLKVDRWLMSSDVEEGYKANLYQAYRDYCEYTGLTPIDRTFQRVNPLPYVPLEKDIDQLVSGMSQRYGSLVQLIKETGFRIGEAVRLKVSDFDFERGIVTLNTPEKGSNPRQLKLSNRCLGIVNTYIHKRVLRLNDRIWDVDTETAFRSLMKQRKRVAERTSNHTSEPLF